MPYNQRALSTMIRLAGLLSHHNKPCPEFNFKTNVVCSHSNSLNLGVEGEAMGQVEVTSCRY